jgi:hypothetical protein
MIPPSVSATSLLVSEACMERWKAENFYRTPQMSSKPADVGTTCHFALETFVKAACIDKIIEWDNVAFLNDMYRVGYVQTFGSADYDTPEFKDGAELIAAWYDRNKLGLSNTVISCEVKSHFPIKSKAGEIPFTYIWDRFDQIDETTFEVIDYKSLRAYVTAEQLKQKIQPRAYALAAQIEHPEAQRIWVTFDMLRHGGPVGAVFTRDENAATYRYLQRAVNRIIDTDEDKTEERLNEECKWCIRKSTCETLLKSIAFGGIAGLSTDQLVRRRFDVANAVTALKYAQEELDTALFKEAESNDLVEWETDEFKVTFTARKMRKPNSHGIAAIVGPELCTKYGNFSMSNIDKMLKSNDLTPAQKAAVEKEIVATYSSPTPKITEKKDM